MLDSELELPISTMWGDPKILRIPEVQRNQNSGGGVWAGFFVKFFKDPWVILMCRQLRTSGAAEERANWVRTWEEAVSKGLLLAELPSFHSCEMRR